MGRTPIYNERSTKVRSLNSYPSLGINIQKYVFTEVGTDLKFLCPCDAQYMTNYSINNYNSSINRYQNGFDIFNVSPQ